MITPGIIDLTYFKDLIGKDNPVILDIGCNDGSHTMKFLELFNEAKVYSFEPDSRAIERYRNKVKDKRAKLFDIAIVDVLIAVALNIINPMHLRNWFANCCYCTS